MPLRHLSFAVMTPSTPPLRLDDDAIAPHRAVAFGAASAPTTTSRSLSSELLFAGAKEVLIVHGGSLYRLKQTALGKLILTK